MLNYLINGSRLYWREELENRLEGIPETEQDEYATKFELRKEDLKLLEGRPKSEWETYRKEHKFSIAGPLLTPTEQLEQKQHLINKIYSIGYLLHRFKDASRAWWVFAIDNKISDAGEAHGGSGKSICYEKAIRMILQKSFYLDGRNSKMTDNPHMLEGG